MVVLAAAIKSIHALNVEGYNLLPFVNAIPCGMLSTNDILQVVQNT